MKSDALFIALLACLLSGASFADSDIALAGRYEYRTDPQRLEMLAGLRFRHMADMHNKREDGTP